MAASAGEGIQGPFVQQINRNNTLLPPQTATQFARSCLPRVVAGRRVKNMQIQGWGTAAVQEMALPRAG